MFAINNKMVFQRLEESIQLYAYCMKVVLNVKKKQKLLAGNTWEKVLSTVTSAETRLTSSNKHKT